MLIKYYKIFSFITFIGLAGICHAGITGTLSGKVTDKDARTILPGAAIMVEGTTMGTMADKNGHYVIYNLPAGIYDVSVSMIGYSRMTIKNVTINIDLTTPLDFKLIAKVLPLNEVVITESKKLIQSDITSSTYFISGKEISDKLPIDSYLDAIALLPGVVGNHIRGGRDTDVLYLLDGLPVQSGLSRQISSYFPDGSIAEMMVQTGGFSAEYGHATSGIVNVISKDGRNEVEGNINFYSDYIKTPFADSDNSHHLEFNLGGPLTIGLGGPLINANYFLAADLNLSDTQHRQQLQDTFDSPVFTNYNINSKLSFNISRNTILTFQGLISNWKWRQFDSQWAQNPFGLAENKHFSNRLSASLTHTFSSRFFASVRYGIYSTRRLILGNTENNPPQIVFQDPRDAESPVLSGGQPREETTREKIHIAKIDILGQLSHDHIIKAGIEVQDYQLQTKAEIYEPISAKGNNNKLNSVTFNRIDDDFTHSPGSISLYIQDKISINKISANIGVRYDVLAPNINIENSSDEFRQLQLRLKAPVSGSKSSKHTPISPRIGISLPLSDNDRVHVNYGWYYQMPPFYYFYTNSPGNPADTYLPLVGNTDLEPTKTISTEFSYKRVVTDDFLFVLTGFTKRFENLIDTRMYVLSDSLINAETTTIGYTQYLNLGFARASGFEITLQKRITSALKARLSYTYMKARGNSSKAEAGHERALSGQTLKTETDFPLSWDQRHSFIFIADYQNSIFDINLLYRVLSPLPATNLDSQTPNDMRLNWRHMVDLRVHLLNSHLWGGRLRPFFEIRNLLDHNNLFDQQDNSRGVGAYHLFDPINTNPGRRLRIGMTLDF